MSTTVWSSFLASKPALPANMSFFRTVYQRWTDQGRSYGGAVGWCPTSDEQLEAAEARLLKHIRSIEDREWANIGPVVDPAGDTLLTYRANSRSSNTPLVLLHGFGCASALWCLNVDHLAADRPVYFMDMLGFGRSSRPTFSKVPLEAEDQMVEGLEAWRRVAGLDKFLLVGHSLGAYQATAYAMKYPDRVIHLILEDPWGFPEQTGKYNNNSLGVMTMWVLSHFVPPLFPLRWLGPLGHWYVYHLLPFDTTSYGRAVSDHKKATYDYFYHCNARNPTGEVAFHSLMRGVAWALYPMINRMHDLREDVPMTLIHGQLSWVSKKTSYRVQELRANSYVDIKVVPGAGHMIHSDKPDDFNSIVSELCAAIDRGEVPSTLTRGQKQSTTERSQFPNSVKGEDNLGTETKTGGSDCPTIDGNTENTRASMNGFRGESHVKDTMASSNSVSRVDDSNFSFAADQAGNKLRSLPSDQNSNRSEVSS